MAHVYMESRKLVSRNIFTVDAVGEGESGTGGQSSISIYRLSAGENVAQGARSGAL